MKFPIPLENYKELRFDLSEESISKENKVLLQKNIQLLRDAIIFMTAYANAKGVGGHTGGPYDIVPEVLIMDAFMRGNQSIHPVLYDEAGHRVAIQYVMAALDKSKGMTINHLLHYREHKSGLPGHPELDKELGVDFSSGRLGHLWGHVNGVCERLKDKKLVLFGSDGSQQEGNDAESARYAVAHNLNVVLLLDDNNVTIEGHPKDYLPGFEMGKTLEGHGMKVLRNEGEDLDSSYAKIREALLYKGPAAIINKRSMAAGVDGIEGTPEGHDAIPVEDAVKYLEQRGYDEAVKMLRTAEKVKNLRKYLGSSEETGKCRSEFGAALVEVMGGLSEKEREKVLVFSVDLGGSTGVNKVFEKFPDRYRKAGVMERHDFLAAGGFGAEEGYQGVFATFSAFSEMVNSEIKMERLNDANVLAHFSHAGEDWMADNTCHYGDNISFVDNGLMENDNTMLYFPVDALQMNAVVKKIYHNQGLRFVFSTRSSTPFILDEKGNKMFDAKNGYKFVPGKDEIVREGKDGYIVSYGEMLYRCLDAVEQLRKNGLEIGLVNKVTLNIADEEMLKKVGSSPFVLFVESQNKKSGFGNRYANWLLERGFSPKWAHMAATKLGQGGIYEHIPYQGLAPEDIKKKVKELCGK